MKEGIVCEVANCFVSIRIVLCLLKPSTLGLPARLRESTSSSYLLIRLLRAEWREQIQACEAIRNTRIDYFRDQAQRFNRSCTRCQREAIRLPRATSIYRSRGNKWTLLPVSRLSSFPSLSSSHNTPIDLQVASSQSNTEPRVPQTISGSSLALPSHLEIIIFRAFRLDLTTLHNHQDQLETH